MPSIGADERIAISLSLAMASAIVATGQASAEDCVSARWAVARGMFLCGSAGELRVELHSTCAEARVCEVRFGPADSARVVVAPGARVGSVLAEPRGRVPAETFPRRRSAVSSAARRRRRSRSRASQRQHGIRLRL